MPRVVQNLMRALTLLAVGFNTVAQPLPASARVKVITNELIFAKAPFRQCHASSLVELSGGRIMAVWFGGTYERNPDVCIWGSIRDGKGWSTPFLLANGIVSDALRYPCWNPVLFKSRTGVLFLFYKIGPSPDTWWGMVRKSSDEGITWTEPQRLPAGILGPIKDKPITLPSGRIISPSSVETATSWKAHMEISDDNGNTWRIVPIDTSSGFRLIQPTLLTLQHDTILALMRSNQNCIIQSRSTDQGNSWSIPQKTVIMNPNSGIDAVTLRNGLQLLVYNPAPAGKDWSDGRSKLYVAVSDDGNHWQDVYKLEDNTSGEYSYPAIIQSDDGLVHITYTYNRTGIRYVVMKIIKHADQVVD